MKKLFVFILLFTLFLTSCINKESEYTNDFDINGEYFAESLNEEKNSLTVIIKENSYGNSEFKKVETPTNFFIKEYDLNEVWFASLPTGNNDIYGYYLIKKNTDLYLYCTRYYENNEYNIETSYKLTDMKTLETALPKDVPNDFSFEITFGFDGRYNSKTGELRNGYNNIQEIECETTLFLGNEKIKEIYALLKDAKIDTMPDNIIASHWFGVPSYNIYIKYSYGDVEKSIVIYGADFIRNDQWECCQELANSYYKIINEYIKNTNEFKSLPENTNIYE